METSAALVTRVTCPHCWGAFAPEQSLWVSEHADLLGDPVLGPEQQQRFLPSRFTLEGYAVDGRGMTCRSLACPKCHLEIPRAALEMETLFLSILGGPASGKSFLLTAMVHELRRLLPLKFALDFTDVNLTANRILNQCEEALFFNPEPERAVPLADLIRKTDLEGELYETISLGHQAISYPRPFIFNVRMRPDHLNAANALHLARLICLYDNAGEHFLPGRDTTAVPVTRHLAQSRAILFVFDPMQDERFLTALRARGERGGARTKGRTSRQELIILEAAARIRTLTGLALTARHHRPIVVVLTKADQWVSLLSGEDVSEPWRDVPGATQAALDTERITARSDAARRLLLDLSPEIVSAVEGFASEVVYIPTSALGVQTEADPETGLPAIQPREIRPQCVTVPILYTLTRVLPGVIPKIKRKKPGRAVGSAPA